MSKDEGGCCHKHELYVSPVTRRINRFPDRIRADVDIYRIGTVVDGGSQLDRQEKKTGIE